MILFWLTAVVLAAAAAFAILRPLLHYRPTADVSREAINARIFKERLADLDLDRQEGRIDDSQYQGLRAELERTLLADVPVTEHRRSARPSVLAYIAAVLAVAIPALALVYYHETAYQGTTERWLALNQQMRPIVELAVHRPENLPEEALADLPGFTRVLQAKVLREGLDNPDSLYALGLSYLQLGQPQLAEPALARAYELDNQQTDYQLAYAQALLIGNEGRLTPEIDGLLSSVLKAQPEHQGALMLLGFGSFHSGDYQRAIDTWTPLLAKRDPNSEAAKMLRGSLEEAQRLLTASRTAPAAGPTLAAAAALEQQAGVTDAAIDVQLTLAPELQAQVSPDDTLFVFAKAAAGPPMPLAVVRARAGELPLTVTLDDSKAMSPQLTLSAFPKVVVSARISKSGTATAQPDDVQGPTVEVDLSQGRQTVALTIGGTAQAAATPAAPVAATTPAKLTVNVAATPELQDKISQQDTLFVFARAANGSPMPLAVVKVPVEQLPVTVTLDDTQAMMPDMTLSKFSQVIVTARISRTGDATASPGDLQGISPTLDLNGEQSLSLVIDQIVP